MGIEERNISLKTVRSEITLPRAAAAPVAASRLQWDMGPPFAAAGRETGEEQLFASGNFTLQPLPSPSRPKEVYNFQKHGARPGAAGRKSSRSLHDLLGRRSRHCVICFYYIILIKFLCDCAHVYFKLYLVARNDRLLSRKPHFFSQSAAS